MFGKEFEYLRNNQQEISKIHHTGKKYLNNGFLYYKAFTSNNVRI